MSYSLNEVEATAKKATRGAGHAWGLAEEAGKAARWLCAQGLDGCGALARSLAAGGAAPDVAQPGWCARGPVLCPLQAGAALADRAQALQRAGLTIGPVGEAVMLFPFAALVSRALRRTVVLDWESGVAVIGPERLELTGMLPDAPVMLTCRTGGALDRPQPRAARAAPDPADWAALLHLAHRTYAPATEESRLKGAG